MQIEAAHGRIPSLCAELARFTPSSVILRETFFGKNLLRARNLVGTFSRERLGTTGSSAQLRTPHTVASAQLFAVFAGSKRFARKGTHKFGRGATRRQA